MPASTALSVDMLNDDVLSCILRFFSPYDLTSATHLSQRFLRLVSLPTRSTSLLWRALLSSTLSAPLPLLLQPLHPSPLTPLSYRALLAFTPSYPSGFSTSAMVVTRGHQHEMRVERSWADEDVWFDHERVMLAVEEAEEREEEAEKKSRAEEGDVGLPAPADEGAVAAMEDVPADREANANVREEGEEEDDGEDIEWAGDEEEDDDEEMDDDEDDDEGDEDQDEDEEEEEEEDGDDDEDDNQPPADAIMQLLLRGFVEDNVPNPPLPPQPDDEELIPGAAPLLNARLRRLLQDPVHAAPAQRLINAVRQTLQAQRVEADMRRQREEQKAAELSTAFLAVGDALATDTDRQAFERRETTARKLLLKWFRQWSEGRRRRRDREDEGKEGEAADEEEGEGEEEEGEEGVCDRVRYSNNTQGGDRAVILNRPFPFRLPGHRVPFTVVERMRRQRYDDWRQRYSQQLHPPADSSSSPTLPSQPTTSSDETQRKRARPNADPAPTALAPVTRHPSLSLPPDAPYITVARLSMVAYFELSIERDDSEDTARREREAQEAADRRRLLRSQRALALGPDDLPEASDDEADAPHPRHRFAEKPQCVSIGLATMDFPLVGKQPGWDKHSWGYHGDDGALFHGSGVGSRRFGPAFGAGDVVGCGLDYRDGSIIFTRNGRLVGVVPTGAPGAVGAWYGVVGLDSRQAVRLSVRGPFAFDVGRWEAETDGTVQGGSSLRVVVAESDLREVWREEMRKRREKERVAEAKAVGGEMEEEENKEEEEVGG